MTEAEYLRWAFAQEINSEWVDGGVILVAPVSDAHDEFKIRFTSGEIGGFLEDLDLAISIGERAGFLVGIV